MKLNLCAKWLSGLIEAILRDSKHKEKNFICFDTINGELFEGVSDGLDYL